MATRGGGKDFSALITITAQAYGRGFSSLGEGMPFDATSIAPAERARLVRIGSRFGSADVARQADKTLGAIAKHGSVIAPFGFRAGEVTELREAREALGAAGVLRADARAGRKSTSAQFLGALRAAKSARMTAHANLKSARRGLARAGSDAALRAVDAALRETRTAGADPEELAVQLDQLRGVVGLADVAGVLGAEGARLVALLSERAAALRAVGGPGTAPRGTPSETEAVDLIDGVIVELVRAARAAARAAGRELGQAGMAQEFELTELYAAIRSEPEQPGPPVQ